MFILDNQSNIFTQNYVILQQDQTTKDKALQSMAAMSSAQIVSATAIHNKAAVAAMGLGIGMPGATAPVRPPYSGASVSTEVMYRHRNELLIRNIKL